MTSGTSERANRGPAKGEILRPMQALKLPRVIPSGTERRAQGGLDHGTRIREMAKNDGMMHL